MHNKLSPILVDLKISALQWPAPYLKGFEVAVARITLDGRCELKLMLMVF